MEYENCSIPMENPWWIFVMSSARVPSLAKLYNLTRSVIFAIVNIACFINIWAVQKTFITPNLTHRNESRVISTVAAVGEIYKYA